MSEERPTGFRTADGGNGTRRITDIGHDPWRVKELSGVVTFKRADASALKVTELDFNGYSVKEIGSAKEIKLSEDVMYYLIGR